MVRLIIFADGPVRLKETAMAVKKSDPVEPSDELFAALREFIRTEGSTYLKDPNVTSIGVGYKVRGGKQTKEISIQFTVATKPGSTESAVVIRVS
jgi:hypothetical protein